MLRALLILFLLATSLTSWSQTKTTEDLDKRFEGGLSLFFYKNTLRMLNQAEDKEFDEMIKDVEKMRFLMIDTEKQRFAPEDFQKLKKDYQSESYEEMMSSRFQGKNFNVYIREKDGDVKGTVILASDSTSLIILDILGKVALDKATALFRTIDGSTDITNKIKSFTAGHSEQRTRRRNGN